MTAKEFDAVRWTSGIQVDYEGGVYRVVCVEFHERLIGISGLISNAPDEISWIRCENAAIHASK